MKITEVVLLLGLLFNSEHIFAGTVKLSTVKLVKTVEVDSNIKILPNCPKSYSTAHEGVIGDSFSRFDLKVEDQYKLFKFGSSTYDEGELICHMGPEKGETQFKLNMRSSKNCDTNMYVEPSVGINNSIWKDRIEMASSIRWILTTEVKDSSTRCEYKMANGTKSYMAWQSKR